MICASYIFFLMIISDGFSYVILGDDMKREFYQDFLLDSGAYKVDILSSKISGGMNRDGECSCTVSSRVKIFYPDREEEKTFEVVMKEFPFECSTASLKMDVLDIQSLLTCSRLTLYGKIEINAVEKGVDEFKIDPTKESLIQSYLSFQRNKRESREVDVISTLPEDEMAKKILEEEILPISCEDLEQNEEDEHVILSQAEEEKIESRDEKEVEEETEKAEESEKKEEQIEIKEAEKAVKQELLKENFVSPYFYYRLGKDETLNDALAKWNVGMDEFLKCNSARDYHENSLIRIRKK